MYKKRDTERAGVAIIFINNNNINIKLYTNYFCLKFYFTGEHILYIKSINYIVLKSLIVFINIKFITTINYL